MLETFPPWCFLKGIRCGFGVNNQSVTEIHLTGNTSYNPLKNTSRGSLPSGFGFLGNLENLKLADFQLDGSIPTSIGSMQYLTYLDLTGNYLTGTIPNIGTMSGLVYLHIRANSLTGTIPTMMGSLRGLKEIYLDRNSLRGAIPWEFRNLQSVQDLILYDNRLSGNIPDIFLDFKDLRALYLGTNNLQGRIPRSIGKGNPLLYSLSLSSNSLTGTIPVTLTDAISLVFLSLDSNQLDGTIPPQMSKLGNLYSVNLNNNYLTMGSLLTVPTSTFPNVTVNSGNIDVTDNCLKFTYNNYNQGTQYAYKTHCKGKHTCAIYFWANDCIVGVYRSAHYQIVKR